MTRRLSILSLFCLLAVALQAQVATWGVRPGIYSNIETLAGDLFVVTKDGRAGVIGSDGTVVVPAEASRITGFYEGYALALKSESGQERILGILSKDGRFRKVDGTYFAIPEQEFFSGGLLSMMDSRGNAGYMDTQGVVKKTFDGIEWCSPFSEGYASIGYEKSYRLIDSGFNIVKVQLGIAPLWGGANPYKGQAILWDGNGKFYDFDINTGVARPASGAMVAKLKPYNYNFKYDYLGCLDFITNRGNAIPYEKDGQTGVAQLKASEKGGKYGYVNSNGDVVVPYQFDAAQPFYGDRAIVKTGNSYGLLRLHLTDEAFKVNNNPAISYKRSGSRNIQHRFSLTAPAPWNGKKLVVRLTDPDGVGIDIEERGGSYEFRADGGKGTKTFSVDVEGDGLKLWSGRVEYTYTPEKEQAIVATPVEPAVKTISKKDLKVTLTMRNKEADSNNRCYVRATVTNLNATPVTANVSFAGSSLLAAKSERVTIPANGSKTIDTYFTLTKAAIGQKVTCTTSAGGSATLDGLQLIPYQ